MATRTTKYEIYLMNVPFNNSYSDVVLFNSHSAQENTFKNLQEYHYTNLNIIVKNSAFILSGRWDKFNECNYMMWRYKDDYGTDNDHTSKWYFSFIEDVQYNTRLGTIISHTLDVWQTYHIDTRFNRKTFIERGMPRPTNDDDNLADNFGRWTATEPLSTFSCVEKEITKSDSGTTITAFQDLLLYPILYIDTLSRPAAIMGNALYEYDEINPIFFECPTSRYDYGGTGAQTATEGFGKSGIYRFVLENPDTLQQVIPLWSYAEKTVIRLPNKQTADTLAVPAFSQNTHLTDIINIGFIPAAIYLKANTIPLNDIYGNYVADEIVGNINVHKTSSVDYQQASGALACNYTPHNKKMYTSLCRAFKIYNKNGLVIPIKTELLTNSSSISISFDMSSYSNSMKITLRNYNSTNKFFDIPYNYSMPFGYNSNVGTALASKQLGLMNANFERVAQEGMSFVKSGVEIIGGAVSLVAGGLMAHEANTPMMSQAMSLENEKLMGTAKTTLGAGAGLFGKGLGDFASAKINERSLDFNYAQATADAYTSIGASIGGTNASRTNMYPDFIHLRLADCSPLYDDCVQVENFLDRYGYTIKEIQSLNYFIQSRKYWNFVKTIDCQLKTNSPNNDNVIFNNIFNSGVTIWKDISYVGNFTYNNYQTP